MKINKLLPFIIVGLILVAIPITTLLVRQQQIFKSRAATTVTLHLTPVTASEPVGQSFDVIVSVDSGNLDISGVDISLSFTPGILQLANFTPSTSYSSVILNGPANNDTGNFRFIEVNNSTSPITGNNIALGTLHFSGKAVGSAQVKFLTTQITASGQSAAIPTANNDTGNYNITNGSTNNNGATVSLILSPATGSEPVNQNFDVNLSLNGGSLDISGADITLHFDPAILTITGITPSSAYGIPVANGPADNNAGTYRYIVANSSVNPITGNINLGTIHLTGKAQGTSTVTFLNTQITASGQTGSVPTANNVPGSYNIGGTASTCSYQSTQVEFRTSTTQAWGSSGSVSQGTPVFIAGFHNSDTTTLPSDVTLSVSDPNFQTVTIPAGNNVSFTPDQAGPYVVRASTSGGSGTNCTGSLTLPVGGVSATPVPTGSVFTVSYKLAETIGGLTAASWKDYNSDPIETTFTFADASPGAKQLCVQFKASDGSVSSARCAQINLITQPTITGCNLDFDSSGNVAFTIFGRGFGADSGSVTMSNGGAVNPASWSDTQVKTQAFSNVPSGHSFPITLITPQGASARGVCSAISQLALVAKLFCPQVTPADISGVQVLLAEGIAGGKVYKQDNASLTKDGVITGLTTKLVEGRNYALAIKLPKSVRRVVSFTAVRDTTDINITPTGTNKLPLGDIFPLDGGDGVINSADKAEMNREWVVNAQGVSTAHGRPADLNGDGAVNSFDWSCMRQDFGAQDDPEPEAGVINISPTPAPTSSSTALTPTPTTTGATPTSTPAPTSSAGSANSCSFPDLTAGQTVSGNSFPLPVTGTKTDSSYYLWFWLIGTKNGDQQGAGSSGNRIDGLLNTTLYNNGPATVECRISTDFSGSNVLFKKDVTVNVQN